jgi:hypothetical protein
MKEKITKTLVKMSFAVAMAGLLVQPASAATLNVIVPGYYGGNFLSDSTTKLPDGTVVDFGVFYSGGAFTSQSSIAGLLDAVKTDSVALQGFRANNGWVSFGTVAVAGGNGDFDLQWDLIAPASGPGFGVEFNLDPSTGALAGKSLIGVKPYVWVQTTDSAPEFWAGVSNAALPAAGFGALFQGDVVNDGTPGTGFTMLLGTAIDGAGITTIPEPASGTLAAVGLVLLGLRRKASGKS